MSTFRITTRKHIPRDPKKMSSVKATSLRSAIKAVYIKGRVETFTPGRGHRFPPQKPGDVSIIGSRELTRAGRTFKVFDVGQPREDGVVTHHREIIALV